MMFGKHWNSFTYCPVSRPLASSQICCGLTFLTRAWIPTKLATPGRFVGSYVTSDVKSVMALLIFLRIASGGSRNVIRLLSFGSDFDCFFAGSRSERIRPLASWPIIGSIIGKVTPNFVLNTLAKCVASCSCCNWSSPHGTCVALKKTKQILKMNVWTLLNFDSNLMFVFKNHWNLKRTEKSNIYIISLVNQYISRL